MKLIIIFIAFFLCSCEQKIELEVNEENSYIWVGAMVEQRKKIAVCIHYNQNFNDLNSVNLSKDSYLKLLEQLITNDPHKYQGQNEWVIAINVSGKQYNINFVTHPKGKSILKSIKDEINSSLGGDEKEKKIYLNKLLDHLLTININPSNKVNPILSPPK